MKTILLVSHHLGVGGTEKNIKYIVQYLSKKNWNIYIYCIGPKPPNNNEFNNSRITIINSKYSASNFVQLLQLICCIAKKIKVLKPDILLSFLTTPSVVTILGNYFFRVPHIASERNNPILLPGQSKFWTTLRYILYSRLTCLVVQSTKMRTIFERILFYSPPIYVIKNAINLSKGEIHSEQTVPSQNNPLKSKIRFLYIGRLEYQKGVDILIRAFPEAHSKLLKEGTSSELLVIGSGSMKRKIDNIMLSPEFIRIRDNITFLGETRDVKYLLESSDILVIPSRSEGFPNVLLEAWSVGLPVIASTEALAATDVNRSSVLLYQNNRDSDLATKMVQICLSDSLRQKLAEQSATILSEYDSSYVMPQWHDILNTYSIAKHKFNA